MPEEPEEGLESGLDGVEPEGAEGLTASVFLSSVFAALSVAASFFSSTFSLSAAGALEALSVTLFTTSLPASPVSVPSPLETASFTLSRTLSISSWVTSPGGLGIAGELGVAGVLLVARDDLLAAALRAW